MRKVARNVAFAFMLVLLVGCGGVSGSKPATKEEAADLKAKRQTEAVLSKLHEGMTMKEVSRILTNLTSETPMNVDHDMDWYSEIIAPPYRILLRFAYSNGSTNGEDLRICFPPEMYR